MTFVENFAKLCEKLCEKLIIKSFTQDLKSNFLKNQVFHKNHWRTKIFYVINTVFLIIFFLFLSLRKIKN